MKRIAIITIIMACALAAPVAHADLVAEIASHVGQVHSYAQMMAAMQELHVGYDRVTCSSIGTTREGRHISMAVVCDPEYNPMLLRKMLIIGRQHGNEASGTEAALALIKHFAASTGPAEEALLRRVALLVVPMANPDGASRSSRRNAAGVDLNRDWVAMSQPETRAIEAAFKQWRPDVVIDLHELPASSSKASYQENFLETIATSSALPAFLGDSCGRTSAQVSTWMKRYGIPLNCYYDSPGADMRLCHRHFGLHHKVPSYLFEAKNGGGRTLKNRSVYHILGTLVIANQLAYHHLESDLPPMQMAAAEPEPAAPETVEPERTCVTLGDPVADSARDGRTLLWAEVDTTDDFAYLSFEIDGRVLVLTNQAPYQYSLDASAYPERVVELAARAYDSSGRCIATDERTVTLPQGSSALGE
ncbi:MAG: DUF2817 domain-containing protein [candidate division WS1 bacterium]|nr:DUF2817 domain-containing protein [candidate division WS1 bacterium]